MERGIVRIGIQTSEHDTTTLDYNTVQSTTGSQDISCEMCNID